MQTRFVLLSDIHVGLETPYEGRNKKLSRYSLALLRQILERVCGEIKPDFVVQLGDLIEDSDAEQDAANYQAAMALFDSLKVPVLHAIGNHDTVNLPTEQLLKFLRRENAYYSIDVGDFHCVVLMAMTKGHTEIHIGEAQRTWLRADLQRTTKPSLVFLHHPIDEQDVSRNFWFAKYTDYCFVEERRELREIIQTSGKVVGVFNGHVHQNSLWIEQGIPHVTIQSMVENLSDDLNPVCSQSYAIVDVDKNKMRVEVRGKDPAWHEMPDPFRLLIAATV